MAAVPANASAGKDTETPKNKKTFAMKPPPAAPTYRAGAKIPPKKPNPIHKEVIKIFPSKIINKNKSSYWSAKILFISFVPKPSIWGTKIPIDPQINAARIIWNDGVKPVNLAVFVPKRILNIKRIANKPKAGEQMSTIGVISVRLGAFEIIFNPRVSLNTPVPTVDAVIEDIAIAPPALNEKCLSIASWAKTNPAIGALNPAEIAAATPHPIKIPGGSLLEVKFSKKVATVAPKWTSGPYWPTEAPPLADINAAKVDPKPFLTSKELFVWCAAKIESGGPCQRSILKSFLIKTIKIAAIKREIIGANEDEKRSDDKWFLILVTKDTPLTNKLETIPNVQPTLKPIKSSEKRSTNKFFSLLKIGESHKIYK